MGGCLKFVSDGIVLYYKAVNLFEGKGMWFIV